MADHELFEAMLAGYPADKRELARQVYHRFADGDSTEFFSQLFLILDVYAHYAGCIFVKSGVSEKQIRQIEEKINGLSLSTNLPVQ
jgi:hypothetical protein